VALIALVALAGVTLFGENLAGTFQTAASRVS
jgi:Flp pilus assembly pilin Flp